MADTINIGNVTVEKFYLGSSDDVQIYLGSIKLYPHLQEPCFAVVTDVTQYQDRTYVDVYNKADGKWYKLNNLNQYEQYGIYASGRTECTGDTPSRLPQGYTEVEYIENTSTAYLNLNINPTDAIGNSFVIESKLLGEWFSGGGSWEYLISNEQGNASPYYGFGIRLTNGSPEALVSDETNVTTGLTLNSDSTSSFTLSVSSASRSNTTPITLFCGLQGSTVWRNGRGKLYSFKLTLNNTLVRDLVPCKRDSDDKYGMYDLITDTFYLSPNNVDFSGGEPITPTDCVTTYEGKLTIDNGYEYEWNGGSWINVGEVSGSSRVPIGYTEVEYIENTTTGTNYYIDTQFKPNQDTRVILEAQPSVINNNPRMFGSGPWNGLAFVGNIENTSPQKFYFKYGQTSSWYTTNTQADTNKHTFDLNKNSYYIDGVLAKTASTSTFQLTTNLGIFNAPATSLFSDTETFIGKVFSCKIYDNGTLIRDYVPCKRDSDSKSGLYDVVNDVFYTAVNASYNFTLGAETGSTEYPVYYDEIQDPPNNLSFSSMTEAEAYECPWVGMTATIDGDKYVFSGDSQSGYEWVYNPSRLPVGYTEVEYIENTGTSYLNIAFTPNQDTRVVMQYQMVTDSGAGRFWGAGAWNSATGLEPNYEGGYLQMSWLGKTSWTRYNNFPADYNKHLLDLNKNYLYLDETLVGSNTYTTRTASDPIGVFTYIGSGRPSSSTYWGIEHFKGKMYSFKVYDNGTLVRDLVPCIKDSDNTVGAYDLVNDVFYTVPTGYTTDKLVAGNPV